MDTKSSTSNLDKLEQAFEIGDIYGVGSRVYDANMRFLFSTTELRKLRDEVAFERIDSGGSPTWRRKNFTE